MASRSNNLPGLHGARVGGIVNLSVYWGNLKIKNYLNSYRANGTYFYEL